MLYYSSFGLLILGSASLAKLWDLLLDEGSITYLVFYLISTTEDEDETLFILFLLSTDYLRLAFVALYFLLYFPSSHFSCIKSYSHFIFILKLSLALILGRVHDI